MPLSNKKRKIIETRALTAARSAGTPILLGELPGEESDFTFNAGALGVEVSELRRPAGSNCGIMRVTEESYHQEILELAQTERHAIPRKAAATCQ
jgi:hypothetical protein